MNILADNWQTILTWIVILALVLWIVQLHGGPIRLIRSVRGSLARIFRPRSFHQIYLAAIRRHQQETPALLIRHDSPALLDLISAYAELHLKIEGAPDLDNDPDMTRQRFLEERRGWFPRIRRYLREQYQCTRPVTTPGGAIWHHPRLVIRGDPGSGKTTLLKHIAVICANELTGSAAKVRKNGVREQYGWPRPFFPIYIPLRQLTRACPDWEQHTLLAAYEQALGAILGPAVRLAQPGWFEHRLAQGGCLVLIDGFDELRDELRRNLMARRIIELEAISARRSNRVVVTTRRIGYEHQLDGSFTLRELAPLNPRETAAVIQARYQAIAERERSYRHLDWEPEEKSRRLIDRIEQSSDLRRLSRNPLLLALIVGIHHNQVEGELPQERYRLYGLAVEYLVERWELQRGREAGEQLTDGTLTLDQKQRLVAELAWAMFTQPVATDRLGFAADQRESYLLISRHAACGVLARTLEPILGARVTMQGAELTAHCYEQARIWLSNLGMRGGLLQGESNADALDAPIQFAHKSIQEYLAAQAVAEDTTGDRRQKLLAEWHNPDWREILLLYAASQRAEPVVRHLMEQGTPRAHLLAGWCLYERPKRPPGVQLQGEVCVAVQRLLVPTPDMPLSADENNDAMTILDGIGNAALDYSLLEQAAQSAPAATVRARAVELLTPHAQEDPALRHRLAAVADNDPDYRPRLAAGFALARHDPRYDGDGWIPELVEIPAGPFLMGSSDADEQTYDDEKPQHTLDLPTYSIGKTPVTNAQWRRFVKAGGYTTRRYWTRAGWRWVRSGLELWEETTSVNRLMRLGGGILDEWLGRLLRRKPFTHPRRHFWNDPDFNGANQPVVGISWYEAVAYCRWLSEATGQMFYLPSEAEWEKAARGPAGLVYPWGHTWEAGRCNSEAAGIGRTTPVGSFPAGASPYGVLDMAGNVFEWCATRWPKEYPYRMEDERGDRYLAGVVRRVLRGGTFYSGSFWSDQEVVRGAYRYNTTPRIRNVNLGMRVARRSPQLRRDE